MGWSPVVGLLQSAGSGFAPVFVRVRRIEVYSRLRVE